MWLVYIIINHIYTVITADEYWESVVQEMSE